MKHIEWWNKLTYLQQDQYSNKYFNGAIPPTLTNKEIKIIYGFETN